MPELPEVEYTARQLRATIVGATIDEAQVFWPRIIGHPDLADFLVEIAGKCIEGIRRRGKFLLIDLSGDLFLSIHRRMTGNFLLLPPGWTLDESMRTTDPVQWSIKGPTFVAPTEQDALTSHNWRYCRACFNFTDGRRLLFTDPRKFGRVELWPCEREDEALNGLGPEPLHAEFTATRLIEALAGRKTMIKQALLAQDVVAGVGNIYADEALYYASIHPARRVNTLTADEIAMLHEGIVAVLTAGIEHGGTSFNDYRDLWGEAGDNYNHVRVYQKDGTPCLRCGTLIERIVLGQRGTHFCPGCQQLIAE